MARGSEGALFGTTITMGGVTGVSSGATIVGITFLLATFLAAEQCCTHDIRESND